MNQLPQVSGRDCINVLAKKGFCIRRRRGSHVIVRRDTPFAQISIPDHRRIATGTLRAIIRQAGLSIAEFNDLL